MVDKWIISDTHFGHKNIIRFTKEDGSLIRPGFTDDTGKFVSFYDIQHHDEMLADNWNKKIKPGDKVYHLGDFGNLDIRPRLNGRIRLILGNHDAKNDKYQIAKWFEQVIVSRKFTTEFARPVLFTHFPVHRDQNGAVARHVNVHGHIHEKVIRNGPVPDPWYINVCVEHTNHGPISWDELSDIVRKGKY